jgi:hypothetical protein
MSYERDHGSPSRGGTSRYEAELKAGGVMTARSRRTWAISSTSWASTYAPQIAGWIASLESER